ncbi:hypothetical protein WR25_17689 [Diploscapter pachys]|uniref:NTF2 domain-containing protein n=1 Tax=Diploscapter pachys TaxID=2018661 RepID=A0A2A2KRY8_9BILA|nr:hypothetical protein WR25_17689 [Diploscapter pachys]
MSANIRPETVESSEAQELGKEFVVKFYNYVTSESPSEISSLFSENSIVDLDDGHSFTDRNLFGDQIKQHFINNRPGISVDSIETVASHDSGIGVQVFGRHTGEVHFVDLFLLKPSSTSSNTPTFDIFSYAAVGCTYNKQKQMTINQISHFDSNSPRNQLTLEAEAASDAADVVAAREMAVADREMAVADPRADEDVVQANENVVQADEDVVQANENVVQADENVVQADEDVVQAQQKIILKEICSIKIVNSDANSAISIYASTRFK